MSAHLAFTLPWPPTVNHLFPTRGGKRRLSEEACAYVKIVGQLRLIGHIPRRELAGPLAVRIVAHPPDARARDLDNLLKAPLDALKKCGLIRDDADFDEIAILRAPSIPGGRLLVQLRELGESAREQWDLIDDVRTLAAPPV